jgi:hypothetical protein
MLRSEEPCSPASVVDAMRATMRRWRPSSGVAKHFVRGGMSIVQPRHLATLIVLNNAPGVLDSPDYACALIALRSVPGALPDEDIASLAENEASARRRSYERAWVDEFEDLLDSWMPLKMLNVPGYSHLSAEYEEHLYQLRQLTG